MGCSGVKQSKLTRCISGYTEVQINNRIVYAINLPSKYIIIYSRNTYDKAWSNGVVKW